MWEKFLTEINWPISMYPGSLNENVVFAVVLRGAPICLEMKIESFIDNELHKMKYYLTSWLLLLSCQSWRKC